MCDKAVNTCPFVLESVRNPYMTQELYDKVVFDDPFVLKYCHDKYETQEMSDKVADSCLYC